jgi:putative SOS response-associated peptidase YedK
MCGRYDLNQHPQVILLQFSLGLMPEITPRYNIAPSQSAPVVRLSRSGERECALLRWGLIPYWAKDEKIGYRTINARAETVATAPAFRSAFERRHCVVIASGFYEWKQLARGKQPYRITPVGAPLFGFAGLWERWKAPSGETIESYTIITTVANEALRGLHERMPVILAQEDHGRWLDAGNPEAGALLRPCPAGSVQIYPVSSRVNNARFDDPSCIEPLAVS